MDRSRMVFVTDTDGTEYACPVGILKGDLREHRHLDESEKRLCLNMAESVDVFNG